VTVDRLEEKLTRDKYNFIRRYRDAERVQRDRPGPLLVRQSPLRAKWPDLVWLVYEAPKTLTFNYEALRKDSLKWNISETFFDTFSVIKALEPWGTGTIFPPWHPLGGPAQKIRIYIHMKISIFLGFWTFFGFWAVQHYAVTSGLFKCVASEPVE